NCPLLCPSRPGCGALHFLRGLICMYSMCSSGILALSRVGRSRPDREALTPLSLMRVHTGVFFPAHTH
ncbi:Serine/threonine-protein kinase UL13, partial [Dissostichus eleginoides]